MKSGKIRFVRSGSSIVGVCAQPGTISVRTAGMCLCARVTALFDVADRRDLSEHQHDGRVVERKRPTPLGRSSSPDIRSACPIGRAECSLSLVERSMLDDVEVVEGRRTVGERAHLLGELLCDG